MCCPSSIQSLYSLRTLSFTGLLMQMSSGCSREVMSRGITRRSHLFSASTAVMTSVVCPLKEFTTSMERGLRSTSSHRKHTAQSHLLNVFTMLQPFWLHQTINLAENFSFFGSIFLQKTTYGRSHLPSTVRVSITVASCFSLPVVRLLASLAQT